MPHNGQDNWRDLSRYHNYLLCVARARLNVALHAAVGLEDVVQDALTRSVEKFDQFRGDGPAQLKGWLRTILLRELHRAVKDLPQEVQLDGLQESSCKEIEEAIAEHTPPDVKAQHHEDFWRLEAAVGRLSDRQREAIRLKYLLELDTAEVRARMNLTIDALGGLLRHGMKNLRDFLDESE